MREAAEAATTTETVEEQPTDVVLDGKSIRKAPLSKAQMRAMRHSEKLKARG